MTAPRFKPGVPGLHGPRLLPIAGAMVALLCTLGCGSPATAPSPGPEPPGPTPARIEAVYPPPRSTGVIYDTRPWVRFAMALDTTTVDARHVALMADTRRLAIALVWEPSTKTLHIVPLERLELRHTYTIELTPSLRFADGATLGQSFTSQFTTNSLRRVESPLPMDGQGGESPFVALRWGGLTEGGYGQVRYEIHVASDPAQAADPGQPALATVLDPLYLPKTRWRQDGPNYWAIHAIHSTTGERMVGPVWRFDTLPADAPYDSVLAPFMDFTWVQRTTPNRCTGSLLEMGPDVLCVLRWRLGPPDSTVRLAGAAFEMSAQAGTPAPGPNGPSVWYATSTWTACDATYPGPPFTDEAEGRLADAFARTPNVIRFSSDALAAHVEATRRLGGLYGYLFRSGVTRRYVAPFAAGGDPVLWLYYYRR
jgi:hypothetical protein